MQGSFFFYLWQVLKPDLGDGDHIQSVLIDVTLIATKQLIAKCHLS